MTGGQFDDLFLNENKQALVNFLKKHKAELIVISRCSTFLHSGGANLILHYNDDGELVKYETRQISRI
jgi:hypothetical protein